MLDPESITLLADKLSELPDPTYWFKELELIKDQNGENIKSRVAMLAKIQWLKKVCGMSSYPLHTDVKWHFRSKHYLLNNDDNLLVWATIVALIDGDDAEYRYQLTKNGIQKKYGPEAWTRVERAARKINGVLTIGPDETVPYSFLQMASRSVTIHGWVRDQCWRNLPRRV